MNPGEAGHNDATSTKLRERAESKLQESEISDIDSMPTDEMLRELKLRRIELELQGEELRQYRTQLEQTREHYADLYFNAPVGYLTLDDQGQISDLNYLAAELLGSSRKCLREQSLFDAIKTGCQQKVRRHFQELFNATGVHTCTFSVELTTGSLVHLKMLSIAVEDPQSEELQCRSALFDITEQYEEKLKKKQLEEQLHESHRMETLGRLASGIAHDFNNLLTLIIGYSKLAINYLPDDHPLAKHVAEINKAGHHASELIEQLLAFSRPEGSSSGSININELIEEMERMLDRLIGDDVDLQLQLPDNVGVVDFESSQFQQVLMNLVVNGRDAMKDGGTLYIRSRNVIVDADKAGELELTPGRHVVVEVEDGGTGIAPEVIPHLFEPFFKTKSVDDSHGFGLSTAYGIVTRHGGCIDVISEPGQGTTFSIYLPQLEDSDSHPSDQSKLPTVMVVDDQPDLRDFATLVLEEIEVEVISARSSEEALKISRAYGDQLDLIVTDVTMPGMSGPQLLEKIRQFHPDAQVLYISGYDRQSLGQNHDFDAEAPFLEKPFSPDNLLDVVEQMLDEIK